MQSDSTKLRNRRTIRQRHRLAPLTFTTSGNYACRDHLALRHPRTRAPLFGEAIHDVRPAYVVELLVHGQIPPSCAFCGCEHGGDR